MYTQTRQESLAELFSDMHKSLYGCRARWAYDMSEEDLERSVERLGQEIEEEFHREENERKELAAQCHVSEDDIIRWEKQENEMWKYTGVYKIQSVDQKYIESLPAEPYEEAHYFELGKAA